MSTFEKEVKEVLQKNPNLRFEDLSKILIRLGYSKSQPSTGSSHYIFRKKGCMPITIPRQKPIKRVYIEKVSEIIKSNMEAEDGK